MNDVLRVDILKSLADLKDVAGSSLFSVTASGLRVLVLIELSFGTILEDQVDLICIVEESVQLNDVLVT